VLSRHRLQSRPSCLLREALDDPNAFADFYDVYSGRVLGYFARRVGRADLAFDLMSETFAKTFEHRAAFRGTTAEEEQGWLFAIARSELSHYWRRGAVERAALGRLGIDVEPLMCAEVERVEEEVSLANARRHLAVALRQLPAGQRNAVGLRVISELGYPDIAEHLGVTEDVVRARVSRGLRALRGALA
jgi:RNA polymerase sigma-70 factor (ECF subfamily)